ncbi:unnamed protein product [Knipowitschia caucasica]
MNEPGMRRSLPEEFSGSGHTLATLRHQRVNNPILSKRVCFYKSGDPQFNGLQMVINNRTFKTFDALLDSLSKKVPLPFGVRNITTPRGVHAVSSLDDLEDGKSYICSDQRKVKPINLSLARKKPPPWYHVRPVSSRSRTIQQPRFYPGSKRRNLEPVAMRAPKQLLVLRNGDPELKCFVLLQKKTTPTFESILEYISELMQFNVTKLLTPEGRRVDGLPGLIMSSGIVVAAGKEKFIPANYSSQKPLGPTRMRMNRRGVRRLKALNYKKRSYAMKPRILSPSSERYIVRQIHNTMAESTYSMPTNSIEMDSSHVLESVAESEAENFAGVCCVESQDFMLPADDDIEKSFRVNQDGSMTVEMKVRLTIKEEETLQWTTTLSRSSVSNQLSEDCFLAPELEQEINQSESQQMDLQPPATTKDIQEDMCITNPTTISNGEYNQEVNSEEEKSFVSPLRTPSPGKKRLHTKQASVESITSLTKEGFQEDIVGSYYREHLENGDLTEQYCMVKHTNSRPVPKPRRVGSVDSKEQLIPTYKAAEVTGIFQMDSSGEEVTETVMHIYEQQTCQDNFLANICTQAMSTASSNFCRPASSDTGHPSSNMEYRQETCGPSTTASESVSLWRSESISLKSNLTSQNTDPPYTQALSQEPAKNQKKGKVKTPKERKGSPKHKVKRLKSPRKNIKEGLSKDKSFPSARFISKIYGNKSKSKKDTTKHKKRKNELESATQKGTSQAEHQKTSSSGQKEAVVQQTYLNTKIQSISPVPLPVISNSGTNEYVEDWLEKSQSKPHERDKEPHRELEKLNLENDPCLMSVAEKVKCLKEKPKASQNSTAPLPELTRNGSVRQKVKCFENKSQDNHLRDKSPTNNLQTNIMHKSESVTVPFVECSNDPDLPPPPESMLDICSLQTVEASAASSPLYRLSSVSDVHPLSTSPTSDRAISPTDRTTEMVSSILTDSPAELKEAPFQRAPSIKRAPLVSNLSLERKMSLRKVSLDEYTIPKDSVPHQSHMMADNSLGQSTEPAAEQPASKRVCDSEGSPSASLASPSDHRTSSSVLSNETSKTIKQHNQKELVLSKQLSKKGKVLGSPSPERRQKPSSEGMNRSPRLASMKSHPANKNASPNVERKRGPTPSASPASERSVKSKLVKKASPYSQSLDLASPPVKHKISKKSLLRNQSTDSPLAATNKKMPVQKRTEQEPLTQSNTPKPEQATTGDSKGDNETRRSSKTEEVGENYINELNGVTSPEIKRNESASLSLSSKSTNEKYDSVPRNKSNANGQTKNSEPDMSAKQISVTHQEATAENQESQSEVEDSDCYVELNVCKPQSKATLDDESESGASDAERMQVDYLSGVEVHRTVEDVPTDVGSEEEQKEELNAIAEEPLSEEGEMRAALQKQQSDMGVDSGNDHCSFEDNFTNNDIISVDEEVSCDEQDTAVLSGYTRDRCDLTLHSEDEKFVNMAKKICDDVLSQSVCEHEACAEDVARGSESTVSQRKQSLVSDGEESSTESCMSQHSPSTHTAPLSSLSFSYDSTNVITKQPEANRVKSIREMFLAKNTPDDHPKMSPNTCDITEVRRETSVSAGYQSQTSGELSNAEEDSSRKSISKGFVMRTIERLYGKKDSPTQLDKSESSLYSQKQKKKDQTSIFSPILSKTASEFSYFNSLNAVDALNEARCIAFNAQVVPADTLHNNREQCFLQDSPILRKCVSDPVSLNQSLTNPTQEEQKPCKEEKVPYLLFKTDSEEEQKSQSRKCTYFSLPHSNDSDAITEESAHTSVKAEVCSESKDKPESTKIHSEKNGKLSGGDFRMMDNKVHPLVKDSPEEAVVVQPLRGQGVVNRRAPEPDMLDFVYHFCGEHCPIL